MVRNIIKTNNNRPSAPVGNKTIPFRIYYFVNPSVSYFFSFYMDVFQTWIDAFFFSHRVDCLIHFYSSTQIDGFSQMKAATFHTGKTFEMVGSRTILILTFIEKIYNSK